MKSSFRKRINSNLVQPIATKISSYTSQLLISSGIPSYDDILFYKNEKYIIKYFIFIFFFFFFFFLFFNYLLYIYLTIVNPFIWIIITLIILLIWKLYEFDCTTYLLILILYALIHKFKIRYIIFNLFIYFFLQWNFIYYYYYYHYNFILFFIIYYIFIFNIELKYIC